jgi:glyoxylase-like metal-dependent hydrolase (beta-lactamase superfamily II)
MVELNVAEGVHRIEDAYTNWYLLEGEGGRLTVIDAGVPPSWDSLTEAVRRLGRSLGDVAAVVLTHAHFDHIGFAEKARARLDVPVWVHENDVPLTRNPLLYGRERSPLRYLRHREALPIMAAFARTRAFRPPSIKEVRRFGDDGALDVPGSPRVVFTPGHTLGHCALHLPDRDVLLAGDAVVMLDPYTGKRRPQIVSRAATADSERAVASLDALAATGARTVLTGHGEPWRDGVEAIVAQARASGIT